MKNLFIASLICSAILAQGGFAQEALRKAVDSNNWKKVKKIVNSGELEEIYCGKMSAKNASNIYGKHFKQMPDEAFAACPSQFAYGFGPKVCSMANAANACSGVIKYLLADGEKGSAKALKTLDEVAKAATKTKAFGKQSLVSVDTTVWKPCPKKGAARTKCIAQCKVDANSLMAINHDVNCKKNPEQMVDKTIKVYKPSPVFASLREGLSDGFWKAPMSVAGTYAALAGKYAKVLSIPDTAVTGLHYVKSWAAKHKGASLPGGQLFRFCTAWKGKVDPILSEAGFSTRCPVFKNFVDKRDKQVYKVKEIGGVDWFVENLNYNDPDGSMCYDRDDANCKTFGRLYTQEAAKKACPAGYHLATDADWKKLEEYAGGARSAALKLKSNGSDDYAFTAMFGGYANKTGVCTTMGEGAYFWTADSEEDSRGKARTMFSSDKDVGSISVDPSFYLAVRCVAGAE